MIGVFRGAGAAGSAAGSAALVVFFAGLGDRLAVVAPLSGMVTRYFGIIGGAVWFGWTGAALRQNA